MLCCRTRIAGSEDRKAPKENDAEGQSSRTSIRDVAANAPELLVTLSTAAASSSSVIVSLTADKALEVIGCDNSTMAPRISCALSC